MTDAALLDAGVATLAAWVRRGEVSARALAERYLARVAGLDGALGAYLTVDEGGALAAADAVDATVARGDDPGPLAGVPLALKDLLVTRGLRTTAASKMLEGWVPPYDGTAVARLRAAGAVVLGKLNCDEFGMGSSTEHSALGRTVNPWDHARVPGGSSGGSAAAVAAGLCAGSLGTDTGGSIRQPAALCGVVGLKPTYGRVSRYGMVAFASSLDQIGPLGRSVADCAALLTAIAGVDPLDASSIDAPLPDLLAAAALPAAGLRVGLPREYLDAPGLADDARAAVHRAADALRAAGATVVDVSLPTTPLALAAYYLIAPAEAASNLARYDGVRFGHRATLPVGATLAEAYAHSRAEGFGAEVKRRILLGTYVLRAGTYDAYYQRAQQVRTLIRADFDAALATVDVLLTPVTPTAAFRFGAHADPLAMYAGDVFTLGASLAGLPGLAVPAGRSASGLPLGVQLLGRALDEATVVRAGAAVERALGGAAWPPEYAP